MSKIEDLTLTNTLQDGNLLVAWNGGTRSVRVQDAATYFEGKISGNFQPKNTMLTNLAQLGSTGVASQYIVITGVNTVAAITGANLLSNIGGQPLDATLTAIAGLTTSAGDYIEATGVDTFRARKLTVATYAALTAIPAASRHDDMLVYVASRSTDGDGGEGYWRFDSGSSATANGGTILAPDAGSGRWLRQIDFAVTASWFSLPSNFQNAITESGGRPIEIPEGSYSTAGGFTANFPVNIRGVGTGAGPGPASQSNNYVTQFLLTDATARLFDITSIFPSIIEDIQINVDPSARPQTAGGGIRLQSATTNNTFANAKLRNIGLTNVYRGVEFIRPSWPTRDGIYVDNWVDSAFYDETSATAEGLGGFVRGAFLFGDSGSITQGAAIKSRIGYTTITDAAIIGSSYGLDWSIRDYPAGAHRMGLVQIENIGVASSRYRTVDSIPGSMIQQLGVEYSNVSFSDNMVSDVLVEADTAPWLDIAAFQNNIHRNLISAINTGFSYYDIRSGDGVRIDNPIIHHLAGSTATSKVIKVGAQASRVFVNNPLFFGASITTPYDLTAETTLLDVVNGITVAQLPTAKNGSLVWCSDARPGTAPVESGGTGAFCVRVGGAWNALMSAREIRSNANTTQTFVLSNPDAGGAGFELQFNQGASLVHRIRSVYESGDWVYRIVYSTSTDLIRFGTGGLNAILVKDSVSPDNNGELSIERTSNTSLTFKLKGTDGVVRSSSLTLS